LEVGWSNSGAASVCGAPSVSVSLSVCVSVFASVLVTFLVSVLVSAFVEPPEDFPLEAVTIAWIRSAFRRR